MYSFQKLFAYIYLFEPYFTSVYLIFGFSYSLFRYIHHSHQTSHSKHSISIYAFASVIRSYETRRTNHCLFALGIFPTDTPPLFFEMEGVQEVSLALGHDEPVSVGCPLYNEASAVKGCLVLSSNVIAQRLD